MFAATSTGSSMTTSQRQSGLCADTPQGGEVSCSRELCGIFGAGKTASSLFWNFLGCKSDTRSGLMIIAHRKCTLDFFWLHFCLVPCVSRREREPPKGFPFVALFVGRLYGVAALYPCGSVIRSVKGLSTVWLLLGQQGDLFTQLIDDFLLCIDEVIQLGKFLISATEPSATLYA